MACTVSSRNMQLNTGFSQVMFILHFSSRNAHFFKKFCELVISSITLSTNVQLHICSTYVQLVSTFLKWGISFVFLVAPFLLGFTHTGVACFSKKYATRHGLQLFHQETSMGCMFLQEICNSNDVINFYQRGRKCATSVYFLNWVVSLSSFGCTSLSRYVQLTQPVLHVSQRNVQLDMACTFLSRNMQI
jgi:hypothetical protein